MVIVGGIIQLLCLLFGSALMLSLLRSAWLGWCAGTQTVFPLIAAVCISVGVILIVGSDFAEVTVAPNYTMVGTLLIVVFFTFHVISKFRGVSRHDDDDSSGDIVAP